MEKVERMIINQAKYMQNVNVPVFEGHRLWSPVRNNLLQKDNSLQVREKQLIREHRINFTKMQY